MWAIFFGGVILAAVFRAEWFWEVLGGLGLFALGAGVVELDPGLFLTGVVIVVACCWHWRPA